MRVLLIVLGGLLSTFCRVSSKPTIMEIQGDGMLSPFDGRVVETSGVVTQRTEGGEGFFLQDRFGDRDSRTSDGIYVDGKNVPSGVTLPSMGDQIRITGEVRELRMGTALARTQLVDWTRLEIQSSRNPLPDPVVLHQLPDRLLEQGIELWEPLEGMRVSLDGAWVVSPSSRFAEFAVVTDANAKQGSGYFAETQQIFVRSLVGNEVDYNPERILVADARDEVTLLRPGDRVHRLIGVVDYTYGNYKIRPDLIDVQRQGSPRPPLSRRSGAPGDTVITTFNLENLFDLEDDPHKEDDTSTPSPTQWETKLHKLSLAVKEELLLPDILVAQEVENTAILQELGNRINREAKTSYVATSLGSSDRRGIEVGFLWDSGRVGLEEAFLLSGAEVEEAFGGKSPSPGREPLVGVFDIGGQELTIVGNHFKSKGGDDPLFGQNQPPRRETEVQRKAQAGVVRNFVNELLEEEPEAWVLVAGDLNDFPFGEPGEGADHPVAILEGRGGEVPLVNLILEEEEHEAFTFIYQGNSQVLDHLLASPALSRLAVGVDILHFNASLPHSWSAVSDTPIRSSDHDPVEVRLRLKQQ